MKKSRAQGIFHLQRIGGMNISRLTKRRGRSSGVEHNLAKVRVGRSNRLARSIWSNTKVAAGRPFVVLRSRIKPLRFSQHYWLNPSCTVQNLCLNTAHHTRGPFVYRLGRQVFNLERGVRFPYGLPLLPNFSHEITRFFGGLHNARLCL